MFRAFRDWLLDLCLTTAVLATAIGLIVFWIFAKPAYRIGRQFFGGGSWTRVFMVFAVAWLVIVLGVALSTSSAAEVTKSDAEVNRMVWLAFAPLAIGLSLKAALERGWQADAQAQARKKMPPRPPDR